VTTARLKDGRTIVLRAMGKPDIVPAGNGRCPANCRMVLGGDQEPTTSFRVLAEKLIDKYGALAILALDGDAVAGFVNFYPTWCPHFDLCSDEQIEDAMAHMDEIENPRPCDDPALHVRCLTVRAEYRGNGLAVALLECLKRWALGNGWRAIVGNGCIFAGRAQYQWLVSPKPPKPIWEKAGFAAADYPALGFPARSSEESARQARAWYLSDDFPTNLTRDVSADDPDWQEIFAGYTMVCRL